MLRFGRLIAAGLASFRMWESGGTYDTNRLIVELTAHGGQVIDAWRSGELDKLRAALKPAV